MQKLTTLRRRLDRGTAVIVRACLPKWNRYLQKANVDRKDHCNAK